MRRVRSVRSVRSLRVRSVALGVGFTAFAGLTATACVDLFHDTDFPDACEINADAPGCTDGAGGAGDATAGDAGPTGDGAAPVVIGPDDPLCTSDATMAAERVAHACAYLSACGGALGVNAPSACLTQARMVYDCHVAPARPTIGPAGTFWRCIANAASCGAIDACIEPGGTESCSLGNTYVACDNAATDDPAANVASRIACDETVTSLTGIENCSATGRGCFTLAGSGTCTVATSTSCTTGCTGTVLHSCDDGGTDQGVDCASFGAGTCAFSSTTGAIGCTAVGAPCTATSDVTCDGNGVAHGCPSGVLEAVDCPALTGVVGADACTVPGATGANAWDVSRACVTTAGCAESCGAGGIITACVLGAPATLDCSAAGSSSCLLTSVNSEDHPACD